MIVLAIICAFSLLLLVASAFINHTVKSKADKYFLTVEEASAINADCIMVLGARVYSTGKVSDMLRDRLTKGIELYNAGASQKMLMSGDHGTPGYDEVNAMKNFAQQNGVPEESIFLDHAGFSTYESAYRAKHIFQVKKMIIVTQQYHLYRAVYIARKLGIEAYGVATDYTVYRNMTKFKIREYLARNKDYFFVMFGAEPTYKGDVIPISGSGTATHDK